MSYQTTIEYFAIIFAIKIIAKNLTVGISSFTGHVFEKILDGSIFTPLFPSVLPC